MMRIYTYQLEMMYYIFMLYCISDAVTSIFEALAICQSRGVWFGTVEWPSCHFKNICIAGLTWLAYTWR